MLKKNAFNGFIGASLIVAGGLGVVACGDDDDDDDMPAPVDAGPGVDADMADDDGMMADAGDAGADVPVACPTHPQVTTLASGACAIAATTLSAPMTMPLTLTRSNTWVLTGPLFVGADVGTSGAATGGTTLTVAPGTVIFGQKGSFVAVQRGSKIMAEGLPTAPIVFTSSQPVGSRQAQDWGGLIISGRATINNGDANGEATGEGGSGKYGGDLDTDNSGILKYVRVEFAGDLIDQQDELNGIAFQGVGSGTEVDYVQAHVTADDGIEFFGGTVNVKHAVVSGANDDMFDWTGGWRGKAQHIVLKKLADTGAQSDDPRGIEADNNEDNNALAPFSAPVLSNVTIFHTRTDVDVSLAAMRLRRGTKGQIWNSVATSWGLCLKVTETQTETNVTDGSLVVKNLVLGCATPYASGSAAETLATGAGANVVNTDPMLDVATFGIPAAASAALTMSGAGPTDPFFDTVAYSGAFDGTTDWTAGWTETAVK